ncbi:MAG TPA: CoA transferase, partial [Kofleriaceae bacterium]
EEVEARMIEHAIPAGRMYRAPEMLADPHFAARQAIIDVETERWGKLKMQSVFPKLSETPGSVRSPAATKVGQHNLEVYGGLLGTSEAELRMLEARGVI